MMGICHLVRSTQLVSLVEFPARVLVSRSMVEVASSPRRTSWRDEEQRQSRFPTKWGSLRPSFFVSKIESAHIGQLPD
jgi:hypothetical protein